MKKVTAAVLSKGTFLTATVIKLGCKP
jgi:hypothetical protein